MSRLIVLLFLFLSAETLSGQQLPPEFIARKGLPNFLSKARSASDTITVAYLGGSITETRNGWRDQTFNWLKKQYPQVSFKQVDAAIGGTTSVFGAYRLEEHVLRYKPDLLFVEYAVNDDENSRESILTSMEGIVRKTWLADSRTDICFVYTFAGYMLKNYKTEGAPPTVKAMEDVANFYGIPSINLSPKIVDLINNKKLYVAGKPPVKNDSTFFSADGVHPYPETGHVLYAASIIDAFKQLAGVGQKGAHRLAAPFFSNKLETARMIPAAPYLRNAEKISVTYNKDELISRYSRYLTDVEKLTDSSGLLAFSFTGESIGFVDLIGPASGQLKVWIDNDPPRYINRFDEYCFYTRLAFFFIDGLENKQHTIKIQLSPEKIDKLKMLGKKMEDLENPEQYKESSWMIGRVLLNGNISR